MRRSRFRPCCVCDVIKFVVINSYVGFCLLHSASAIFRKPTETDGSKVRFFENRRIANAHALCSALRLTGRVVRSFEELVFFVFLVFRVSLHFLRFCSVGRLVLNTVHGCMKLVFLVFSCFQGVMIVSAFF